MPSAGLISQLLADPLVSASPVHGRSLATFLLHTVSVSLSRLLFPLFCPDGFHLRLEVFLG